jgi:hypothetical protein
LPAAQTIQEDEEVDPLCKVNLPFGQFEQDACPVELEYVFLAQVLHELAPTLVPYLPLGQLLQLLLLEPPIEDPYLPLGQLMQVVPPDEEL